MCYLKVFVEILGMGMCYLKVFVEILGMGEWAPPFFYGGSATPPWGFMG